MSLKRQKATGGKGRDIISNLPEPILSHILSFLPTKDAVRTSVLSTKWKHKWTYVTNLHFDDELPYSRRWAEKSYFMNFVDGVLLHYANATIQNFSLICNDIYDSSRVYAWISAVIMRKVQKLDISYMDEFFVFPSSLFSCNSLVELKLHLTCALKVPTSLCFPNLKILDLIRVNILNDYFSQSKQLFLNFPVLEVFNSSYCSWLNLKIVDISAPLLDSFTLKNSKYTWVLDGSSNCVIKIYAPCLTKFECEGYLLEDFILSCPSSIVDATVEVAVASNNLNQMREMGFRACRFLRNFIDIKYLRLCFNITEVLAHVEDLEAHLPTFHKLTHLKLRGLANFGRTGMALLRRSPNLEYLTFVWGIQNVEDWTSDLVPECFLPNLKVVLYHAFCGMEHELCIVKFLLKNLKSLKKMTIRDSWLLWGSKTTKKKMKKQLLSFPKASSHASVVVSFYWPASRYRIFVYIKDNLRIVGI